MNVARTSSGIAPIGGPPSAPQNPAYEHIVTSTLAFLLTLCTISTSCSMSAVDAFWAAPPVSRTLTAAAVILSVPTHMHLISGYYVIWLTSNVFTISTFPEVWRFVTSFLLTGPNFGLILDPYFLYTYGSQLETGSAQFSGPGDFFVYIIFLAVTILLSCGVYLGGATFLSPLSLALAYTWSVEHKDQQVTYFIVTFSAKYLPYAMLLLTFVMASPGAALLQATGLLAAHLYLFLTKIWPEHGGGKNLIFTPQFIREWFASPGGAPNRRAYGTAFSARTQTAPQNQTGSGGGWASGFSRGSDGQWGARGQGHRLGGT